MPLGAAHLQELVHPVPLGEPRQRRGEGARLLPEARLDEGLQVTAVQALARASAAALSRFFLICHFWMWFMTKLLGIQGYLLVQLSRELNLFFSPTHLSSLQSPEINIFCRMLLN